MSEFADPSAYVGALPYLGALVFLAGEILAFRNWRDLRLVLLFSTLAECGFVLIALTGSDIGILGAGMHIVYQSVMRALVIGALIMLIRRGGGATLDELTGIWRTAPVHALLFAFGMFSLMGLSPFKGGLSRFLVFYDLIGHGQWLLAALGTVASIVAAIYLIRVVQAMCFAAPNVAPPAAPTQRLSLPDLPILALAVLTAFVNFYPEPVAVLGGLLFGNGIHLPHLKGHWPLVAVVPYLGAFALFGLAFVSSRLRDIAAVLLAAGVFVFILLEPSLDPISRLFALLFSGVILLVTVYSTAYISHEGGARHYYFFLFLMAGSLIGVATISDLGSFYLFWELMTWTSYLLIVHSRRPEALKAGALYFIMCAGGAYVMHLGIVGTGVAAGTFEFSQLAEGLQTVSPGHAALLMAMLLVGFGVKAGFVPLHAWLPVAHPEAPSSVSAPLSSILTKTGIIGILKFLFAGFGIGTWGVASWGWDFGLTISVIGVVTLLYAEVMAWRQKDLKRMLAYSTIAQVGEIAAVLGLATSLAIAGASAHVLAHGMMKTLLFLGAGALIYRIGARQLSALSGVGRRMPVTALCMVVGLLAIMGLPPFAGFTSKFLMIYASVDAGALPVAIALLVGGVIGVAYYGRLIRIILFDPISDAARTATEAPWPMVVPLAVLAVLLLYFGLFPDPLLQMSGALADAIVVPAGIASIVLPSIAVDWPLAAIVCTIGGLVVMTLGRTGRLPAGGLAAGTMALALVALAVQSDRFDPLSLAFAAVVLGMGLLSLTYSVGYFAHHAHRPERFMGMMVLMIAGLVGMVGADDLFSFFFFWEIMSSWTLYFLIVHEETAEALEEGFKYFLFNMIGAAFLFLGVTILGAFAGGLDFAVLRDAVPTMPAYALWLGAGSALVGFAMKAAMFTVRVDYQMHPATAPTPVSGYISSVLLKSGPLMAFKFIALFGGAAGLSQLGTIAGLDPLSYGLAVLGAVTALYAGLMAFIQVGIKRLLIYSTVAQLGYVMCGLALGDPLSTAGGLAHASNHALLKNILFLAAGAILAQQHISNLDEMSGAGRRMPWTFAAFALAGLSLAGVPPLSGLASKWMLYQGALVSGHPFIALLLLGASLTTLAAVMKFIHAGFLGHPSAAAEKLHEAPLSMLLPMGVLTLMSLAVAVFPGLILVPIAQIQSNLGIDPILSTWLGPLPGPFGWHPATLAVPLIVLCGLGWAAMQAGGQTVRRTYPHSCGVPILPDRMRVSADNLYGSPKQLVRKILFLREVKS